MDKDEARRKRIFDMWMACWTQEEIAERENLTKQAVSRICQEFPDPEKIDKSVADHATPCALRTRVATSGPPVARREPGLRARGPCRARVHLTLGCPFISPQDEGIALIVIQTTLRSNAS
jgi:hypothetical protein